MSRHEVARFLSVELLEREFSMEFMRSRGPGGQNVNKTNSACVLRWNLMESGALSFEVQSLLIEKLKSQLTTEFEILIRSEKFRDQDSNKKEVVEKLYRMLFLALQKPKVRKKTKPSRSAKRKRVESKKHRGEIKSGRGKVNY